MSKQYQRLPRLQFRVSIISPIGLPVNRVVGGWIMAKQFRWLVFGFYWICQFTRGFITDRTQYRGYYTVARRYEFYVRVARTISHSFASLTREILFLPREHKIHIFKPTCNVLFIIWRNQFNKSKIGNRDVIERYDTHKGDIRKIRHSGRG